MGVTLPSFFKLMKSHSQPSTNPSFKCHFPDCFCYVPLSHRDFTTDSCSSKVINHIQQIMSEKLQMMEGSSEDCLWGNQVFVSTLYHFRPTLCQPCLTMGSVNKVRSQCQLIALPTHGEDLFKVDSIAFLMFQEIQTT